jgi:hypothetical protein
MDFPAEVQSVCEHAFKILKAKNIKFRPMRRTARIKSTRNLVIGRTNLKTKTITVDIYTPKKRSPKKMSSILRVLCHEIAHHQKKPYRQLYKGRYISRQHYPRFYRQVKKNIKKLMSDNLLRKYFE